MFLTKHYAIDRIYSFVLTVLIFSGLHIHAQISSSSPDSIHTLFKTLTPDQTGINFRDDINDQFADGVNGGGIAIGDINNDGLPDVVLSSNTSLKLYLNLGNMKFKDITKEAGLDKWTGWFTGVNIVDVDGDGWNDIYVCRSGPFRHDAYEPKVKGYDRANLLFINHKDMTFTEEGHAWGIDDSSASISAVFFDFDNDGDLDLYLVNHSDHFSQAILSVPHFQNPRNFPNGANRLLRNDGNHFTDISEEAGLTKQVFLGLNAVSFDINCDGWPDLFVSNDFLAPDILYLNDHGKRFINATQEYFKRISIFTMGSDFGDIDRDGRQDLFNVDMLNDTHHRMKKNYLPLSYEFYHQLHSNIFPPQYSKNSLFLNTGSPPLNDIAYLTGMARTEWSWAPLIQDFDNDGWNDIYVTKGTKRDYFDLDYLNINVYSSNQPREYRRTEFEASDSLPKVRLPNYAFKNLGGLQFKNVTKEWGLAEPMVSYGAAYGDLDNDGDIDLVVCNIDSFTGVYENQTTQLIGNHYIRFKLVGNNKNTSGIGATVRISYDTIRQVKYISASHGFQSSSELVAHFGLGDYGKSIDSVEVFWPGGDHQVMKHLPTNTIYLVYQKDAADKQIYTPFVKPLRLMEPKEITTIPVKHKENYYVDFKRDRLIPFKMSAEGPGLAVGDVNNDGLEDFYIGGAKGSSGQLWLQQNDGTYTLSANQPWSSDTVLENQGAVIADVNGDGWPDLLVANGSNENMKGNKGNVLKLYLNDGKGHFTDASDRIPQIDVCYSTIAICDFDKDGDLDIFAAGRLSPENYPIPPPSRLLVNDGKGHFTDATKQLAPGLLQAGNIRSAVWTDYDKDGWPDLVLAGEWMPVKFFHNEKGKLKEMTKNTGIDSISGLWTNIIAGDFDNDGDTDFIVCNYGKNGYLQASETQPISLYYGDFDDNGVNEQMVFHYLHDTLGILYDRNTYCEQMPKNWKKYFTFESYSNATFSDHIPPAKLKEVKKFSVNELQTCYMENLGNGQFKMKPLPIEAQFSQMTAALPIDVNGDGNLDVVMIGNADINLYQYGPMDGTNGLVLLGDGKGNFTPLTSDQSGFFNPDYGRSLKVIHTGKKGEITILAGNNNAPLRAFRLPLAKQR